ncbi:MAG TPA: autotransporter outer membrane beta-barrel domain-containing protein [Caulobacteraceae bacterium]
MSRTQRRLTPSRIALIAAAALGATPAIAATTTISVPEGTTRSTTVTASPAAGDTIIVDVDGTLARPIDFDTPNFHTVIIQGSGAGAVNIIDDGRIQGPFNFGSATGPVTVTINTGDDAATEGWHVGATTTFGSGADTINNSAAGTIAIHQTVQFGSLIPNVIFNFGAGADTFNNAGRLIVGRIASSTYLINTPSSLQLLNLETFNNTGLIVMGSLFDESGHDGDISDGQANDRLLAPGVAFTGSGDSRIVMDVFLDDETKADCSTQTVADCIDFTGGSTAGSTLLTINNGLVDAFGQEIGGGRFNSGITLIVGSSAAENFTLDPNSTGYVATASGGALDVGLVRYRLVYDADGMRHMLVSTLPSASGAQTVLFAGAGQEVWHETTAGWFDRQADLRSTPGGLESANGFWGRLATSDSERDATLTAANGADHADYMLKANQRTSQLVFGGDVVSGGGADSAWVIGAMLGAVRADTDYESTDMELIYTGFTGGLYASYVGGPLFIDAVLNGNILDVEADIPSGLSASDRINGQMQSVGGRLEGGWRVPVGPNLSIEPLAAVSYVRTKLDDVEGGTGVGYEFEDATSLRAGAGLRGTYATQLMGAPASFSLTGRYWNESEGENSTRLVMDAGTATITDELPGSYSEIDGTLNLFSSGGGASGFVNLGGKFGDDYQAMDASVGVRFRW